jgi:hypothetical protein
MLGSSETLFFLARDMLSEIFVVYVIDGFFILANVIDGYMGRAHVILSVSLKGPCVQKARTAAQESISASR